jgi:hypothetical protein
MLRLALPLICLALPTAAECRLALALAVDVSRSIDETDYAIQTEGLARALEDPEIRRLIFGPDGDDQTAPLLLVRVGSVAGRPPSRRPSGPGRPASLTSRTPAAMSQA